MTQGRKTTPAVIHELRNNPGGRPIPEQIEVEGDIADAPDWFDDEQRAAWNHVVENAPLGLLKLIDSSVLATHCIAVAAHKEATLMLGKDGYIDYTDKGATKRSEWFSIQAKTAEQIIKTSSEMGLTPSSRSKVSADKAKSSNKFKQNGKRSA